MEDPKIRDDREFGEKEEDKSVDEADLESAREKETSKDREVRCEDGKIDDEIEINVETDKDRDGEAETNNQGAVNGTEDITLDGEGSKKNGEPAENGEVQEGAGAVVETENQTKEKGGKSVAEVKAVIENGVETDEETEENMFKHQTEEPEGVDVTARKIMETNQMPE